MKNLTKYIALLTLVALFSASSCKKCHDPANPDCENYDACYGKTPTSASFKIYERGGGTKPFPDGWIKYDTDTATTSSIYFEAVDSIASNYTWYIGIDTFYTRSFRLNQFPDNATIPITLITERSPQPQCFAGDDGVDTLTRYIHTLPDSMTLIKGQWFGYNEDSPQDTFTVTISFTNNIPYIYNLRLGNGCYFENSLTGYKELYFNGQVTNDAYYCGSAFGIAKTNSNDKNVIDINYSICTTLGQPSTYINKKFTGIRKN